MAGESIFIKGAVKVLEERLLKDTTRKTDSSSSELFEEILKKGVNYCRSLLPDTNLSDNIRYQYDRTTGIAYIYSTATSYTTKVRDGVIDFKKVPYLKFVEFGTGFVGKTSDSEAPLPPEWDYDINDHGSKGWLYAVGYVPAVKKGGIRVKYDHTAGMQPRPIMYLTKLYVESLLEKYFPNRDNIIEYKYQELPI